MKVQCRLCIRKLEKVAGHHLLSAHKMTTAEYVTKFPDALLYSEEFIRRQSIKSIEWWKNPKNKKKGMVSNRNRWVSEEQRQLASEKTIRYFENNPEAKERESRRLIEMTNARWADPEKHIKHSIKTKKIWNSGTEEEKLRRIGNFFGALARRPTKPEKFIDDLLQANFPDEFKYNGDYSLGITVAGLIPDFVNVNGKKQIIEVFGKVFHDPVEALERRKVNLKWHRTEPGRIEAYNSVGWNCLVIWEDETKDISKVTEKIQQFVQLR